MVEKSVFIRIRDSSAESDKEPVIGLCELCIRTFAIPLRIATEIDCCH